MNTTEKAKLNIQRYWDMHNESRGFFLKLNKKFFNKFYKKFEKEFVEYNKKYVHVYESNLSFDEMNKQLEDLEKEQPTKVHKFYFFPANLCSNINSWLCCGFKWYDKKKHCKTWNDNYHMMSKLCRYETWDTVHITWWDKIRFKLTTGYKFEE